MGFSFLRHLSSVVLWGPGVAKSLKKYGEEDRVSPLEWDAISSMVTRLMRKTSQTHWMRYLFSLMGGGVASCPAGNICSPFQDLNKFLVCSEARRRKRNREKQEVTTALESCLCSVVPPRCREHGGGCLFSPKSL